MCPALESFVGHRVGREPLVEERERLALPDAPGIMRRALTSLLVHAVHAAVGVFALLVEERGKVLLPPAVGDEPRRGGVPVLDACRAAAIARSRLPASRRGRLPVSSRMLACTWCVLLQYLLGGFGSVFPQCGLMVFPVSSSFPGDVRGIGAAACIFPSCDSNWIRPHAFQRHKRGNS